MTREARLTIIEDMSDVEAFEDVVYGANGRPLLCHLRARPVAVSFVVCIGVHGIAARTYSGPNRLHPQTLGP